MSIDPSPLTPSDDTPRTAPDSDASAESQAPIRTNAPTETIKRSIAGLNANVPRQLPTLIKIQQFVGSIPGQIGWGFLAFGGIVAQVLLAFADITGWVEFNGAPTVPGVVERVESTGSRVNKRNVLAFSYSYAVDGVTYRGTSYSSTATVQAGAGVVVEYLERDPSNSRIAEMTRNVLGPEVGLALGFPLIGLIFVIVGLRLGKRASRLLVHGVAAPARLVSTQPTNTRINNRTVMLLSFEFAAADGQTYTATARTHQPEALTNEAWETVVYDPEAPSEAMLVDALPGRVRLDPNGTVVGNSGAATAFLVLPALAAFAFVVLPLLLKFFLNG